MKHLPAWKQLTQGKTLPRRSRTAWVEIAISTHRSGRVRWQGTTWPAYCEQTNEVLAPGTSVLVVGLYDLTLLVQPLD
ncbi:MAG: NfeD family protein [Spirulinaceae cyanobacterium]